MRDRITIFTSLVLFLFSLVSCEVNTPLLAIAPWNYADLRLLDAADATIATHDLIAFYSREAGDDLQLRLDLLDHAVLPDYDLYIAVDSLPGGTEFLPLSQNAGIKWDTLLVVPASGRLRVLDDHLNPKSGAALQVIRDPDQSTLVISLRKAALGYPVGSYGISHPAQVLVFLTPSGSTFPADSLGPIHTQANPPPPAQTLFVFWNCMPAYSPLLSLRRWDGAHTGPYGGRHGLYNLLRTARSAKIPIALLDMKAPASLASLSHAGGLELVAEMQSEGLLILPEYLPDLRVTGGSTARRMADQFLAMNREITREFNLPTSLFLTTHAGLIPSRDNSHVIFLRSTQTASDEPVSSLVKIQRWREEIILPLPDRIHPVESATPIGPSLELRKTWLETALQSAISPHNGSTPILILGGDLPASTWGSPQSARETFRYINNHPWIRPLNSNDLYSAHPSKDASFIRETETLPGKEMIDQELLDELLGAPDNLISKAAWHALESLYSPVFPQPEELPALRDHYLTNIWSLLAAADWAQNPASIANCNLDPDHDSLPECLLASRNVYTQFEIDTGSLTFVFVRQGEGSNQVHQIIAPSSQFIVGLSDPSTWDLKQDQNADPAVIPGVFFETDKYYQPEIVYEPPGLRFTSKDGTMIKEYKLTNHGLALEYHSANSNSPNVLHVPLAVNPWERFQSDWTTSYLSKGIPGGWEWGIEGGASLQLIASKPFELYTFKDTISLFDYPENPNLDIPYGHTIPFPMAQFSIQANGLDRIEIQLNLLPSF